LASTCAIVRLFFISAISMTENLFYKPFSVKINLIKLNSKIF
jgi:hypothetical protein